MTVLNENLRSDPEKYFRAILDRLDLSYEPAVPDFSRTYRINSSFPETSTAVNGNPRVSDSWQQWSDDQRATFMKEAAPTMLKYRLATASGFNRLNSSEPAFSKDQSV